MHVKTQLIPLNSEVVNIVRRLDVCTCEEIKCTWRFSVNTLCLLSCLEVYQPVVEY